MVIEREDFCIVLLACGQTGDDRLRLAGGNEFTWGIAVTIDPGGSGVIKPGIVQGNACAVSGTNCSMTSARPSPLVSRRATMPF
jgi:hypothetical protein